MTWSALSRNSRRVLSSTCLPLYCPHRRPCSLDSLAHWLALQQPYASRAFAVLQPALHCPSRALCNTSLHLAADSLTGLRGLVPASTSGRQSHGMSALGSAGADYDTSRSPKSVTAVTSRSTGFAVTQPRHLRRKAARLLQAAGSGPALAERQEAYREEGRYRPELVQPRAEQHNPATSGLAVDLAEYLVAYDQLPSWDTVHREDPLYFDWSGRTDYTSVCKQLDAPYWGIDKMNDRMQPVAVQRHGKDLSVTPLWIAIQQPERGGPARLYRSTIPLSDAIVSELRQPLDTLLICTVDDLVFDKPDITNGLWRNYCTGIIGHVADKNEDVLWPNQVLHGNRTIYNLRSGQDLGRFLARPDQQNLESHQQNLRRIAQERHYKPGWSWFVMKDRWGEAPLRAFKLDFSV